VAYALNDKLRDRVRLPRTRKMARSLRPAHKGGRLLALIGPPHRGTLPASPRNQSQSDVSITSRSRRVIVTTSWRRGLRKKWGRRPGCNVEKRIELKRDALKALDGTDIFRHPFLPRDVKLMYGDHVEAGTGTGLVHTAPGHGFDDYVTGAKYGVPPLTPVDDGGVFTKEAGDYAGLGVFAATIGSLRTCAKHNALLHSETITHSYPHAGDRRGPLSSARTEQWFLRIDHDNLRAKVIAEIDRVRWVPSWSRDSNPQHDRDSSGLGACHASARGRADSRAQVRIVRSRRSVFGGDEAGPSSSSRRRGRTRGISAL